MAKRKALGFEDSQRPLNACVSVWLHDTETSLNDSYSYYAIPIPTNVLSTGVSHPLGAFLAPRGCGGDMGLPQRPRPTQMWVPDKGGECG